MKKLALNQLDKFFGNIAKEQTLILPLEKAGEVDFGVYFDGAVVRLDELKTVKSAK